MRRHPFDRSKQRLTRAQAKIAGVAGFVAAIALPVALWHHALSMLAGALLVVGAILAVQLW